MLQSIAQENKKDHQVNRMKIQSENQLPRTADWWETPANREKQQQEVMDSPADPDSDKYIKLQHLSSPR